jgi:hypothetical protein
MDCSVFFGRVETEAGEMEAWVAQVPFRSAGKKWFALMALTPKGRFIRAAVVDEFGEPQEFWKDVLRSFEFYDVPRLKAAKPRTALGALR